MSFLRMVEADRIFPDRFTTIWFTSSGCATPPVTSARSRGFSEFKPSENSSFSNVLRTERAADVSYIDYTEHVAHQADSERMILCSQTTAEYPVPLTVNMPGRLSTQNNGVDFAGLCT